MFKSIRNKSKDAPPEAARESPAQKQAEERPPQPAAKPEDTKERDRLRSLLHKKLLERLDLSQVLSQDSDLIREEVRSIVTNLLDEEDTLVDAATRKRIIAEVLDQTFGLGPLEEILADAEISDILINGAKNIYVEKRGKLIKSAVQFKDDAHVLHVLDKIVSAVGRRCDESTPMVDARLADGSRVNAIIAPCALAGPTISIRRFGKDPVTWDDYIGYGTCTQETVDLVRACVIGRLNVLIIGGTGSGKTTLLNNCSSFIPEDERIVTIEDAAELQLRQPHVVPLETRPANIEGKGRITIGDLLINSLRMRPDRIVVGECRGGETLDMLQAMNTGHDGSLTTVHANSPRDAIQRVETMVMMSGFELPVRAIRMQFASAIDLIVQVARLTGGPRKLLSVTEVQGMEGDIVTLQEIMKFEQLGINDEGKAYGQFMATGVRPSFLERLRSHGADVDDLDFTARALSDPC